VIISSINPSAIAVSPPVETQRVLKSKSIIITVVKKDLETALSTLQISSKNERIKPQLQKVFVDLIKNDPEVRSLFCENITGAQPPGKFYHPD